MIDLGRDDFVNCLAEVLGCSKQTASNKLNGDSKFNEEELTLISLKLGLSIDELLSVKD